MWMGRTPMAYSSPGGTKGSASSGAWAKAARKWSRASSNVFSCWGTLALESVESLIEVPPATCLEREKRMVASRLTTILSPQGLSPLVRRASQGSEQTLILEILLRDFMDGRAIADLLDQRYLVRGRQLGGQWVERVLHRRRLREQVVAHDRGGVIVGEDS